MVGVVEDIESQAKKSVKGLIVSKDRAFFEGSMILCDSVGQMYVEVVYFVLSFGKIRAFWSDGLDGKSNPF